MKMNYMTPQGYAYITKVSFAISKNGIDQCYSDLENRGFIKVDGDIRTGGKKKYVALGYKKENDSPITDIKGVISDSYAGDEFTIGNTIYRMIRDHDGNGDINKGSGGKFLHLYYTTDKYAGNGQPIKDLIFSSFPKAINSSKEVVKNAPKSLRSGDLDINAFRGGPFNYIFVIR